MGQVLSHVFGNPPVEQPRLPDVEPEFQPYYGLGVPNEASTTRDDSMRWYTEFWEQAYCIPHRDGTSVIICCPDNGHEPNQREEDPEDGWAIKCLRATYQNLPTDHARIARYRAYFTAMSRIELIDPRYIGALENGSGLVVEKLTPGPLDDLTVPAMEVPVPDMLDQNKKLILSLYFRWAMQALSAMSFVHSQSIYIRNFSSRLVWIRRDYSLAITGFISAVKLVPKSEDQEAEREERGWSRSYRYQQVEGLQDDVEHCYHPGERLSYNTRQHMAAEPSVEADLFHWATFVWRLMTNQFTIESPVLRGERMEPSAPADQAILWDSAEGLQLIKKRHGQKLYQELEEVRLGTVLTKAWHGQYKSAEEAMREVKLIASSLDMVTSDDEVEVEGGWENAFDVITTGLAPGKKVLVARFVQ